MMNKIMAIFSNGMAVLYLFVGVYILFYLNMTDIQRWQRISVGLLVTGYGVFRIVRAIIRFKDTGEDE